MKKSVKYISLLLALLILVGTCGCGDSKKTVKKSENPYVNVAAKKLSEISSSADASYGDALVAETSLWADNNVTAGSVKYEKTSDLPDLSSKFPSLKSKEYDYKDFTVTTGCMFEKSGCSSVNSEYTSLYGPDSRYIRVDFGKDYEIDSVSLSWSGTKSARCEIQVADDVTSWFNAGKTTLSKKKNNVTVEVNETHRRYLQLYFSTEVDTSLITSFKITGHESNAITLIPEGTETNGVARPENYPFATTVDGVKNPVISLAGTWKYTAEPEDCFWENDADISKWADVPVPGDPDNLNIGLRTKTKNNYDDYVNKPTAFKIRVNIPSDYKNKEVLLRFEGVQNYSRVFVNGQLVRRHRFGATAFDCLITDYVEPGKDVIITVEASYEVLSTESSLYQGICGYPYLMAVPKESISRLQYECDLDSSYKNAELIVDSTAFSRSNVDGSLKISLNDADGKEVKLSNNTVKYNSSNRDVSLKNTINNVNLWDSDHPYLYTLTASLISKDGKTLETIVKKVGFKEVKVDGNQVLVNGKVVKVHGVNWHNLSATSGMVADYWSDRASLIKLVAANVNFIRTSHHPQYSYVFDLCDELGIYVEEEASIAMLCDDQTISYEQYELLVNPKYLNRIINQYAEMVENSRSHASVLYYSLGNESSWGTNIQKGHDYVLAVDGKHPTKFSWGYNAGTNVEIFSSHYPQKSFHLYNKASAYPIIYDEHTHIYGHNPSAYYEDPSICSLYDPQWYWDQVYHQLGGVGLSIWAGRDMASLTPTGPEKYFVRQWGLLDSWNREKEEYWIAKKTFSPAKIDEDKTYDAPASGSPLLLPVENRFQSVNLNELEIECTVNGKKVKNATLPDLQPTKTGNITISGVEFKKGDTVHIILRNPLSSLSTDKHSLIFDEYEFVLGGAQNENFAAASGTAPSVKESGNTVTVSGSNFEIKFDKTTGKITDGKYNSQTVLVNGPDLDLGRMSLTDWKLSSFGTSTSGSETIISISGDYKQVLGVSFKVKIDGTGRIDTEFSLNIPSEAENLGVTYGIKEASEYSWKSTGIKYSMYPENSVARLSGTAVPHRTTATNLGITDRPTFYRYMRTATFGVLDDGTKLTDDYRATKRNILWAEFKVSNKAYLQIESDGKGAVKASQLDAKAKTISVAIAQVWGHKPSGELCTVYPVDLPQTSGAYTGNVVMRLTDGSLNK